MVIASESHSDVAMSMRRKERSIPIEPVTSPSHLQSAHVDLGRWLLFLRGLFSRGGVSTVVHERVAACRLLVLMAYGP